MFKLTGYLIIRVKEIERIYREVWDKLRANERITIISLYFNSPKLIKKGTNFYKLILNYINSSDEKHLSTAVSEVLIHSNEKNDPGIKNRRIYEATLLKSTLAPFYSPPNSQLMPEGPIKIMFKETIVHIGMASSIILLDATTVFAI